MKWEVQNEKGSRKRSYHRLTVTLFISAGVYIYLCSLFYAHQRTSDPYTTVLNLDNKEHQTNYASLQDFQSFLRLQTFQDFFKNYSFYGEEKPKLECWAATGCSDEVIKRDILKRLPALYRANIQSTLVKTGE